MRMTIAAKIIPAQLIKHNEQNVFGHTSPIFEMFIVASV